MKKQAWLMLLVLLAMCAVAQGQAPVMGRWESPRGSVVDIYPCGSAACLKILRLEKGSQLTDTSNPDKAMRGRSLCGLEIGTGFVKKSDTEAQDGKLYDPDSGRTYKGALKVEDGRLKLRGSWGLLWRTEVWTRFPGRVAACSVG